MVRVLDVDAREPNSPPNKSEILARTISTTTTGIAEVLGSNGCVGAASQKLRNRGHAVTRRTKLRCSPKRGYRLNIMEAFAHQQSGQPRVEIGARLCPVLISKVVLYKPSPGRGEELCVFAWPRMCVERGFLRPLRRAARRFRCVPEGHDARRPADGPAPYAVDATPGRCRNVRRGLVPHPPQPAGPVPHVPRAHLVAPVDRVGARPLEG